MLAVQQFYDNPWKPVKRQKLFLVLKNFYLEEIKKECNVYVLTIDKDFPAIINKNFLMQTKCFLDSSYMVKYAANILNNILLTNTEQTLIDILIVFQQKKKK